MAPEEKAATEAQGSGSPEELARGSAIGRYIVLGLVGRGGMGDVYAAYDPELDRKIAVKLLRTKSRAGQGATEGRTRLLREAQAIAKLSHGNVVVVYDVGTFQDAVFIAMEFIEGDTVRYWLNAESRDWRDVMRVFVAAGRGLAAAHEAGIVHRDFKPDNVMVGQDGKVRVMDFGLARQQSDTTAVDADLRRGGDGAPPYVNSAMEVARGSLGSLSSSALGVSVASPTTATTAPPPPAPPTPAPPAASADAAALAAAAASEPDAVDENATRVLSTSRSSTPRPGRPVTTESFASARRALDAELTQTGAMLGTPAYMAPEQFASRPGDARTDQFSFCVALYESLYGERPFDGKNLMKLIAAVTTGTVREPPAGTKVPAWVRKVLVRGLRPAADQRYPSMTELLDALERDPSVARRRWGMGVAASLVVATIAFGASRSLGARQSPCEGGAAKLAGIWEPGSGPSPRKSAIRAAFRATGKSYAERTFATVRRVLDRYAADWTATYTDACEATSVRGEQSAEALDLRMSCLQGRLVSMKALTDLFSRADGEVVEKAPNATQALGSLDRCNDLMLLRAVVKPPEDPAVRASVQGLKPRLAEVKALTDAGHIPEALSRARPLLIEARKIGYLPVVAEALYRLGWISLGNPSEAESMMEEASWAAQAGGDEELFAEAATMLVYVVGYVEGSFDRARVWSKLADATLRRLGGHDVLRSWLLTHDAAVLTLQGRNDEAIAASRQSLTLKERALGRDHPDVAQGMGNLAEALAKAGKLDDALATNARALQVYEKGLGNEHPDTAMYLSSRGELLNALGRYA